MTEDLTASVREWSESTSKEQVAQEDTDVLSAINEGFENSPFDWNHSYVSIKKHHIETLDRLSKLSGRIEIVEDTYHHPIPFRYKFRIRALRTWYYVSKLCVTRQ